MSHLLEGKESTHKLESMWLAEENKEFLFDLQADPLEMTNLAEQESPTEALQHMRDEMLIHLRSTQTNQSAGYRSKVPRLREADDKNTPNE